jgi:hypothetical protein
MIVDYCTDFITDRCCLNLHDKHDNVITVKICAFDIYVIPFTSNVSGVFIQCHKKVIVVLGYDNLASIFWTGTT